MDRGSLSRRVDRTPDVSDFGELCWHVNATLVPGTNMTLGEVTIDAGFANPLHRHDNCEELLYLIEGTLEHRIGDEWFTMGPGDVIRVPVGVPHQGRNAGDGPARMVVAYDSGDRHFEVVDEA
jgi:quercetin dioxygenase-like cupin family protein